jgi:hypothetical protein
MTTPEPKPDLMALADEYARAVLELDYNDATPYRTALQSALADQSKQLADALAEVENWKHIYTLRLAERDAALAEVERLKNVIEASDDTANALLAEIDTLRTRCEELEKHAENSIAVAEKFRAKSSFWTSALCGDLR